MATKKVILKLKIRSGSQFALVPRSDIATILGFQPEEMQMKAAHGYFQEIDNDPKVNDKNWLLTICNWTPARGLNMLEMASWIGLIQRIEEKIDNKKEGNFQLDRKEADMMWERLWDPDFLIRKSSPEFLMFVGDFADACGIDMQAEAERRLQEIEDAKKPPVEDSSDAESTD